ncbi:MAG: HAD family hydrolase [Bacteroidales bacterium]|nr:HAD family hydrolase [Bacteroidales bacterium]
MTRLVILDFDGTLADTQPIIVGSIQRTLAELGLPARSDAECASIIGLPLVECFSNLFPDIDTATAERCADRYREIFDELNEPGAVPLFPHVLETIRALHASGLQLAICSSRGRPTLEGFVSNFHLEPYISMVVSANDVTHHKPHPEPVQIILEQLQVRPEEAVVVGDASYDILMGRAAGCRTVGVTYGNQTAEELRACGAECLIDRFDTLPQAIGS